MVVVVVDNGMNHDCLFVYRNGAVGGHGDPIVCQQNLFSTRNIRHISHGAGMDGNVFLTSLKSQGLAGYEHDIGASISSLHLVLAGPFPLFPTRPGGEVQRCRFVGGTAHIPRAHDAVTVRDGEVEQAPLIHHFVPQLRRRGVHEAVDALDGLEHCLAERRVSEAVEGAVLAIRVEACFLETVQEEGECPFAVGVSLHTHEPFSPDAQCDFPFDMSPAGNVAIVHEHETAVGERVAVRVGQAAFRGGTYVSEDEGGCGFGSEAGEIDAIPSRGGTGEDAGVRSEGRRCVVADAEAIAVVGAAVVLDRWRYYRLSLIPLGSDHWQGAYHAEA